MPLPGWRMTMTTLMRWPIVARLRAMTGVCTVGIDTDRLTIIYAILWMMVELIGTVLQMPGARPGTVLAVPGSTNLPQGNGGLC